MDPASVASPSRETEGMLDGSDAIADWPILGALLNAAQGASWVAVGNGGGVGIGRSIHSGMVVIADGSELAERKIARAFWTDAALGVARYADAGYEPRSTRRAPPTSSSRLRTGAEPMSRSFVMSIDTGGTFTDGFVSDGERTVQVKVDTTPQDLTIGFQACIEAGARRWDETWRDSSEP